MKNFRSFLIIFNDGSTTSTLSKNFTTVVEETEQQLSRHNRDSKAGDLKEIQQVICLR